MTTTFIRLGSLSKTILSAGAVTATATVFAPQLLNLQSAKKFSTVMAQSGDGDPAKADNIYGFSAIDIDGNNVSLEKYRGHVCVVVNVASQ